MTNVQSKLTSISCTCREYSHPWTERCINATGGIIMHAIPHSFRIYSVVYLLSLLMRHRIPTLQDLQKTLLGIIQSSAFLGTNGCSFVMYTCLMRKILGRVYFATAAFVPAFLASLTAIYIERPVRRPLLSLYVANVATETIWKMAESRGLVRSIPCGHALIFGLSVSILLYLYRLGLHKTAVCKDSLFDILRIFVGKSEEGSVAKTPEEHPIEEVMPSSRRRIRIRTISDVFEIYSRLIDALKTKHSCCPHKRACISYALYGGIRPFVGGVGLQIILKVILNITKILQMRMNWRKAILDKSTLRLGIFLGSFSFLYKAVSCLQRHIFDRDDPKFALPAGIIGSIAFSSYPDVTVALYVMWKMLQIVYNYGIEKGIVPKVPGFTILLYCFSTAMLFHAAILEPKTLRHSYWKFLCSISGGRVSLFDRRPLDVWGLKSSEATREVIKRTGTAVTQPIFPFAF